MSLKLNVEFDDYEKRLLREARADMIALYKSKGLPPPSMAAIVRGLVRTGFVQAYGKDAAEMVAIGIIDKEQLQEIMEEAGVDV